MIGVVVDNADRTMTADMTMATGTKAENSHMTFFMKKNVYTLLYM